jgi:hypothetical protein
MPVNLVEVFLVDLIFPLEGLERFRGRVWQTESPLFTATDIAG